jgi:hypothetical protein
MHPLAQALAQAPRPLHVCRVCFKAWHLLVIYVHRATTAASLIISYGMLCCPSTSARAASHTPTSIGHSTMLLLLLLPHIIWAPPLLHDVMDDLCHAIFW